MLRATLLREPDAHKPIQAGIPSQLAKANWLNVTRNCVLAQGRFLPNLTKHGNESEVCPIYIIGDCELVMVIMKKSYRK